MKRGVRTERAAMRQVHYEANIVGESVAPSSAPFVFAQTDIDLAARSTGHPARRGHEHYLPIDKLGLAVLWDPVQIIDRRSRAWTHGISPGLSTRRHYIGPDTPANGNGSPTSDGRPVDAKQLTCQGRLRFQSPMNLLRLAFEIRSSVQTTMPSCCCCSRCRRTKCLRFSVKTARRSLLASARSSVSVTACSALPASRIVSRCRSPTCSSPSVA